MPVALRRTTGSGRAPEAVQKSRRRIPLLDVTKDALRSHKAQQAQEKLLLGIKDKEGWIFTQPDGSLWKPDTFTAAFRRLIAGTDFKTVRFHDLRHTHATYMLQQGIHPKVVSERLGDSNISITLDTYSHVLPNIQADAMEKMNAAFQLKK